MKLALPGRLQEQDCLLIRYYTARSRPAPKLGIGRRIGESSRGSRLCLPIACRLCDESVEELAHLCESVDGTMVMICERCSEMLGRRRFKVLSAEGLPVCGLWWGAKRQRYSNEG